MSATDGAVQPVPPRRTLFGGIFVALSVVFFGFIVAGFGPTFYFRTLTGAEPLPAYLFIHGVILTAWFGWLPIQSLLIRANRRALHRRLGVAGALVGYAAFATGVVATLNMPMRQLALNGADDMAAMTIQFWIDVGIVVAFGALLTAALLLRRRPEFHKRLMLGAYITMMPAPVAHVFGAGHLLIPTVMLALFATPVVFDLVRRRRVHAASWAAPIVAFGAAGLCVRLVAPTTFGQTAVSLLAGLG